MLVPRNLLHLITPSTTSPLIVITTLPDILHVTEMNSWRTRSVWTQCVKWARNHPQRVKAANELPEADRPRPCTKINKTALKHFSDMLRSKCPGIFGGADLLNALVEADIRTTSLPETKLTALIIPVPGLEWFNPKPPFGNVTTYTWGLVHGTTVTGATAILIEGLIRPADWEHDDDPKKSQLPTFGLFSAGQQVSRGDTELPRWAEIVLLDRALKRGKGQQPILVGALYRGAKQHVAMKAGGNDAVQIKVAKLGLATTSEKYVVAHSAHTQVTGSLR